MHLGVMTLTLWGSLRIKNSLSSVGGETRGLEEKSLCETQERNHNDDLLQRHLKAQSDNMQTFTLSSKTS